MLDLVIGASGLLGRNMFFATNTLKPSSKELDITKIDFSYFNILKEHNIELKDIYLFAAYTNVAKSNIEKYNCFNMNVNGVSNIVFILNNLYPTSRLIYISTDYVFDGNKGNYKTTDPLDPVTNNYYALTKAMAEGIVKSYIGAKLIIRTSFCQNETWPYEKAFIDQYTSRDTVEIIAPKIQQGVSAIYSGVLHIGTERKSVYDLARRLKPDVQPCSRLEIKNVNIPYDTSLKLTEI